MLNTILMNSLTDAQQVAATYKRMGYKTKVVVSNSAQISQALFTVIVVK